MIWKGDDTVKKHKYLTESPEDKQIRMVLISTLASIFLCIVCLVGTTWAWFQTTITSTKNTIQIGKMEVAVAMIRGDQSRRSYVQPSGQLTYELDTIGTYSISLLNTGNIHGFCSIILTDAQGNVESFSTGTLNPVGEDQEDAATVMLTVTPQDKDNDILPIKLEIIPHWGEDPAYTIADINEDVFVPLSEEPEMEGEGPQTEEGSDPAQDPDSPEGPAAEEDDEADASAGSEEEPSDEAEKPGETEKTLEPDDSPATADPAET